MPIVSQKQKKCQQAITTNSEELTQSYGEKKEKLEFIHTQMDEMDSRLGKLYDALETGDFKNGELAPRMRGLSQKKEELLQAKANSFSSIPFLLLVKAAQMQYDALSQSQVFRHFRGHLKTVGRFNNDAGGFQTSDVLAGISDAFMVIGKLTYTFGLRNY